MGTEYTKILTECKHEPILDEIRGEYICSLCGLVIEKHYVSASYQMNEDPNGNCNSSKHFVALGKRLNMVDGLGSFIDYQYSYKFTDATGKALHTNKQILFRRLKYHYDVRSRYVNKETNYSIFNLLNRITDRLKLSDNVRDRAAYFYNKILSKVSKENITNHIILIATCIFLAIREYKNNAPVTIQELCQAFTGFGHRVSSRTILREIQRMEENIGEIIKTDIRRSEDYINRVISKICNSDIVIERLIKTGENLQEYKLYLRNKCFELLDKIDLRSRGGRNPYIFAVAILYTSDQILAKTKHRKALLTQKILSDACNCAEYSIRDHFKYIKLNILPKI
ncbi:MAG: hypothetical protein ACTSPY_00390 [Candidatus Helarchaeota archaeon]